jgi:predicted membrane chloride channel (bestrophin family)
MEQMNRTFLYFYIFTVPLTLLEDVKDHYPYMQLIVTVFLTYGFVGLQRIAEELDDPFGNDQNDFNNIAMAQDTFDDVYMMIHGCDGEAAAAMLRSEILQAKKRPTDPLLASEATPLVIA